MALVLASDSSMGDDDFIIGVEVYSFILSWAVYFSLET